MKRRQENWSGLLPRRKHPNLATFAKTYLLWSNETKVERLGHDSKGYLRYKLKTAHLENKTKHLNYSEGWWWQHHTLGLFFFRWNRGIGKGQHLAGGRCVLTTI